MMELLHEDSSLSYEKANFYFKDISDSNNLKGIDFIKGLIENEIVNIKDINNLLDTLIGIFELKEEYEKCKVCKEVKDKLNDTI